MPSCQASSAALAVPTPMCGRSTHAASPIRQHRAKAIRDRRQRAARPNSPEGLGDSTAASGATCPPAGSGGGSKLARGHLAGRCAASIWAAAAWGQCSAGRSIAVRVAADRRRSTKRSRIRRFTPVGPALVLIDDDELKRFGDLRLRLPVNGETRQDMLVEPTSSTHPCGHWRRCRVSSVWTR